MSGEHLATDTYVALARLVRSLRQEVPVSEVGAGGFSVLVTLSVNDPMRPSRLAATEGVAAASMTRILHSVESQGLVERRPDPTDGRAHVVTLTERGRELITAGREQRMAALGRRIAGLSDADRARLADALPALAALSAVPV